MKYTCIISKTEPYSQFCYVSLLLNTSFIYFFLYLNGFFVEKRSFLYYNNIANQLSEKEDAFFRKQL